MIAACRVLRSASEMVKRGSGPTVTPVRSEGPPAGVTETVYLPGRTAGPRLARPKPPPPPSPTAPPVQPAIGGNPLSGKAGAWRRSQQVRFSPASAGPLSVRTIFPVTSEMEIPTPTDALGR